MPDALPPAPARRPVDTLLRLYWGVLVLVGTGILGVQIPLFYRDHPESIGPHSLPLLNATVLAMAYWFLPFLLAVLSAFGAFWRRPLAYAGLLFVHLTWGLSPFLFLLLAWLLRTPSPRAVVHEQWGSVGLMAGALFLLTRPAVRAHFARQLLRESQLYCSLMLAALGYVALSFLL
ncbi:MAG TPA: hypothetical protein VF690_21080 [Hymenobacter sp.]